MHSHDDAKSIGSTIRQSRQANDMTIRQLSGFTGIPIDRIIDIETGRIDISEIDPKEIRSIAKAIKVAEILIYNAKEYAKNLSKLRFEMDNGSC